mgnify:CR=1 FL=1
MRSRVSFPGFVLGSMESFSFPLSCSMRLKKEKEKKKRRKEEERKERKERKQ